MRNTTVYKKIFNFVFYCLLVLLFFSAFANSSFAATLSLSPSATTVSVNNIFTEKIIVNTAGKAVNNAEGTIQFPADLLEVVSVNKGSSIFSLWVEEPSFSNSAGRVTFNGGVPNPGYNGAAGTLATITFKAKKAGTASIIFADGAVRENDGLGTDILTSKSGSVISVGVPAEIKIPEQPAVVVKNSVPEKPVVISETKQDVWYSNNKATFSWKIPNGITSIQASLNKTAVVLPTVVYDNSVSQKTVSGIPDGKSYFHIRYSNAQGYGETTHYRVQIDATAPKAFTPVISSDGYKNIITLDAKDVTSGIDYYNIKIDNLPVIKVKNSSIVNGKYELPMQNQGEHSLSVTAYDLAGNHTEANLNFVSSEVVAPTLSVNPEEIKKGDSITVVGEVEYPGTEVEIFTQTGNDKPISYLKKSTDYGSFSIITDPITESGNLSVWAQISFSDTVKGKQTEKIVVKVRALETSEILSKITARLIVIVPTVALSLLVLFVLYFALHKFLGLRRKINQDLESTIEDIHEIMNLLKKELYKQLQELEDVKIDRKLNRKEQEIFKKIQNKIEDIDAVIEKKLKKLRK